MLNYREDASEDYKRLRYVVTLSESVYMKHKELSAKTPLRVLVLDENFLKKIKRCAQQFSEIEVSSKIDSLNNVDLCVVPVSLLAERHDSSFLILEELKKRRDLQFIFTGKNLLSLTEIQRRSYRIFDFYEDASSLEVVGLKFKKSIETLLDLKNLAKRNAKLESLVVTDELTHFYNPRFMLQNFDSLFKIVKRYERPLSLLMIDIDNLKDVNDGNDHLVGSTAIKEVARVIREFTRDTDVCIRYGGDEFMIALPETNFCSTKLVADRLRRKIEQLVINVHKNKILKVTASVGVATYCPKRHHASSDLVLEADKAMYLAKKLGKNQVAFLNEEMKNELRDYQRDSSSVLTLFDSQRLEEKHKMPKELLQYWNKLSKA